MNFNVCVRKAEGRKASTKKRKEKIKINKSTNIILSIILFYYYKLSAVGGGAKAPLNKLSLTKQQSLILDHYKTPLMKIVLNRNKLLHDFR